MQGGEAGDVVISLLSLRSFISLQEAPAVCQKASVIYCLLFIYRISCVSVCACVCVCVCACEYSVPENNLRDSFATMCVSDREALRACRPFKQFFFLCYFKRAQIKRQKVLDNLQKHTHTYARTLRTF